MLPKVFIMKTLLIVFVASMFTMNAVENLVIKSSNKYCAEIGDGILTVVHQGIKINSDVSLKNGTVIKPNGEVTKPDGSKFMLSSGECIDNDGNILSTTPDNKSNQQPH